jgi:hypothetical protein
MNIACIEDFSSHHQQATTEVVTTNKNVRIEDFSSHHQQATTEVVTTNKNVRSEDFSPHPTNVEIGGLCDV